MALSRTQPAPLPPELRASLPPEMRGLRRDHVRLLVADASIGSLVHTRFDRLPRFLGEGDLVVVNTSRTLAAGMPAVRSDGSSLQLRPCVRRAGSWDVLAVAPAPPHANMVLEAGERLHIGARLQATVVGRRADIPLLWRLAVDGDGLQEMAATGSPIRYSYVTEPVPIDYYQNVYAGAPGSAEMPSAGRPLSWEVLRALEARGVRLADLVLHTGLSSYQDDDFDLEHRLYEERFEIPAATAEAVNAAGRVIAVGTTVVRALESAVGDDGRVHAASGWTTLRIQAGMGLRAVDAMITGLHEPEASHFDLLGAFLPEDHLQRAYTEAVERQYLFHEFGDSMLVFSAA
ncbi:MAG: S-adenosylmethionine:tRNA ribosyltransferase-isomerase [Candidatus Dormibacteria bacterium]